MVSDNMSARTSTVRSVCTDWLYGRWYKPR